MQAAPEVWMPATLAAGAAGAHAVFVRTDESTEAALDEIKRSFLQGKAWDFSSASLDGSNLGDTRNDQSNDGPSHWSKSQPPHESEYDSICDAE